MRSTTRRDRLAIGFLCCACVTSTPVNAQPVVQPEDSPLEVSAGEESPEAQV